MVKIFINAGHGTHDAGAVNKRLNLQERYLAKDLCKVIESYLKSFGITVMVYQEVNSLNEVPKKANEFKADLFVSVHMNASTSSSASGVEVLFCEGSTKGKTFAQTILNSVVKVGDYTFKNRGVKDDSTKHLGVLRYTNMTACLVEMGFISNDTEASFVHYHINECGTAIANVIIEYLVSNNLIKNPIHTITVPSISEKKSSIQIVPSGVNGTYNLIIEDKLILSKNKIETIDKYLTEKYKDILY